MIKNTYFNEIKFLLIFLFNLKMQKRLVLNFNKNVLTKQYNNYIFSTNLYKYFTYYLFFYKINFNNLDLINKIRFLYSMNFFLIKNNYNFLKNYKKLKKKIKIPSIETKNIIFFKINKFILFSVNLYFTYNTNKSQFNNKTVKYFFKEQTHFLKINIVLLNYLKFNINFNPIKIFYKKHNFNSLNFLKFFINLNDYYNFNMNKNNLNFFSNKYLIKYLNFYDNEFWLNMNIGKSTIYNNCYPISKNNLSYDYFLKKFKINQNLNYSLYTNRVVIKFLENILKKKIFIKVLNNYFYKIKNNYFRILKNEYARFKPAYFKNYLISDFIDILWYSFMFKDLKMISNWISKFMESLNFKNHKKFISFFNNFMIKYSSLFIDVLGIKGFFFDIRGKVGVTGSSKKRHLCFKFGSLKKSSKKNKINFNQSLVRTYSGVMGLTYIINY